ncbi:zinc finger protein 474 [Trichonephila clavipes]|nr:zinc finger protein 474 [Trichonephila clavipes]
MSSPGFEPRPYDTAVSVANLYTGWATLRNLNKQTKITSPPIDNRRSRVPSPCCLHSLLRPRRSSSVQRSRPTMNDDRPAVPQRLPIRVYKPAPRPQMRLKQGAETSRVVADKGGPPTEGAEFTRCSLCGEQVDSRKLKSHETNCLKTAFLQTLHYRPVHKVT